MTKLGRDEVDVFAEGAWGKVVGIRDARGTAQASAYLASLPPQAKARFQALAERLSAMGSVRNTDLFRQLKQGPGLQVWEIKVNFGPGHRWYCIQRAKVWIVTHGGPKPRRNALYEAEIRRCRQAIQDWDERQ